jgi:hypothetical protein
VSDGPEFALRSLVADWREIADDPRGDFFEVAVAVCAYELEQLIGVLYE